MLCIAFAAVLASGASAESKRTKIAVLDFQLQGMKQDSSDMGKIVAEWLITALVKEGRFDVIERRLLEKVLEEQKMGVSGLVDESSASKLGKVLGAKIVISGSVMQFQKILEVNARIIEVESSSIIAAENVKSESAAKLENLVVQMAEKIIADFPLEGYIVQRAGNSVLIDLGKRTGVKKGMRFTVYREGKMITHPKTGEVLDVEKTETGTIEITEVKTKTSDATILHETDASAITNGQTVKSGVDGIRQAAVEPRSRDSRSHTEAAPSDMELSSQIASIDTTIQELRRIKLSGSSEWKTKFKQVDHSLDVLEKRYKRSPDVYLCRAKSLEAIEKLPHAEKYIQKALSVSRNFPPAYMLKGDMYVWDAMKSSPQYNRNKDLKIAVDAYESAIKSSSDKDFQALTYSKMGNALADLGGSQEKAKAYWQKAVDIAPASEGARLSKSRM